MDATWWFGLAAGALLVGAVFSVLAQSLRDLSRTVLEQIAEERGDEAATRRIEKILDDPEGHAAAVALPRNLLNLFVVLGLIMGLTGARGLESPSWVEGLAAVGAASLLLWVFSFMLPASVSRYAGETVVYRCAGVVRASHVVVYPILAVGRGVDATVRRIVGTTEKDEKEQAKEEILSAIEEAGEEGKFNPAERDMIEAVMRFREKTVVQVMTPRTDIEAMPFSNNLGQVTATIRRVGHSRIPVYEGTVDNIIGVFYVKDLMRWLAGEGRGGRGFDLKSLLRPAVFVPETKQLPELLREFLQKRTHIAVVADEYGGTAGIVTMEDVVEEVFGDIQDEYENARFDTVEIKVDAANGTAELDARAYIDDANNALRQVDIELPESEHYDTVGGFVTVTLGRIPAAGEMFTHNGLEVSVLQAEPTRVLRIRLARAAAGASAAAAAAGNDRAAGG